MNWVSVNDRLPKRGDQVLVVIDVRKWDAKRKLRIETAIVGFFDEPTRIGGPVSLTGYKTIQGIYFAIPAIMHPEAITHWMPLPEFPTNKAAEEATNE